MGKAGMPDYAEVCLMCWWREGMDCMCEELYMDDDVPVLALTGIYGMAITEELVLRCWEDLPAGSETARKSEGDKRVWVEDQDHDIWTAVLQGLVRFRMIRDEEW